MSFGRYPIPLDSDFTTETYVRCSVVTLVKNLDGQIVCMGGQETEHIPDDILVSLAEYHREVEAIFYKENRDMMNKDGVIPMSYINNSLQHFKCMDSKGHKY